jgi:uncharacterized protein (TIGR03663 family)
MHADESVQATIFRALWEEGTYRYNPEEYHGPTLIFATLPSVWLSPAKRFADTTESTYRRVPVVYGVALILLLWLLADGLGRGGTICASVLAAVSPAVVYYNRYYIHETLLICFTVAAIGCGWRYIRSRKLGWCLLAGVCLGLMQATKETAVISFVAMFAAALLAWLWHRLVDWEPEGAAGEVLSLEGISKPVAETAGLPKRRNSCDYRYDESVWKRTLVHAAIGLAVAVLVAELLLTTFFTNLPGLVDSVGTYLPWLRRAGGESLHIHPWDYYLRLLLWCQRTEIPGLGQRAPFWSEGWILLLAAIGFVASLWRGGRCVPGADASLVRFLAFYALAMTVAYSLIPYKTPWCLLNFWIPTILMAGVGAVAIVRWPEWAPAVAGTILLVTVLFVPAAGRLVVLASAAGLMVTAVVAHWLPRRIPRAVVGAALVAATAHLAWQAYRANYVFSSDPRNPYVYAHTTPNMIQMHEKLEELAAASPLGRDMQIKVITKDDYYWPLPWYLRGFERRGIHYLKQIPDDVCAPIVITVPEYDSAIDAKLRETHRMTGFYALRPQVFLLLFVRDDVWEAHLPADDQ